ncbi:hypothetical protein JQ621_18010 [Bradyrhizobium manausense]|jgi:hypothetical protein|uniref:hypothetical protein n=1 Tax=Bradyrhizobium manausense TaxID=989370 RepID=UPI001BA53DE1|nr:hypothetical protein [Bradyrhizobium manausense]MBR1089362.1 hypothetical protein [Bradyrhizobium manausense]
MEYFLRLMSLDPVVETLFINQIILLVTGTAIDFSQPLDRILWRGNVDHPFSVLVVGADRDRAAAIQRNGIITRWTEFGGLLLCMGYLHGEACISIALSAEGDVIEFTFL